MSTHVTPLRRLVSPEAPFTVPVHVLAEPLAVVDEGGHILQVNPAFADLVGAPEDAVRHTPLDRWLVAEHAPEPLVSDVRSRVPAAHRRAVLRPADRRPHPVDVTVAPLATPGQLLVCIRDLSGRRQLDEARQDIKDLTEQLHRSQKIGALGRLAGGVAHDFNNLLQVVSGHAEALAADSLDLFTRRRLASHILEATDRAAALTRQLLAFGRRQLLRPEVLDLNTAVGALQQMLKSVVGAGVTLVCDLDHDVRPVKVDPGQLDQVVLNLAINARDAMATGGTLDIATGNVDLQQPWSHPSLPVRIPPGAWVRLTVRDTGCGMDADTAAQAFEPFFTTKDSASGSGLGLSMVYGIVKQSGGYTWIETAPGAGTAVHVLLPAVDAPVAPQPLRRPPVGRVTPPPADTVILLVEDDANVRGLFTRFLEHEGYVVLEASDGRDALQLFSEHGDTIDLVVTDVVMPNIGGPALAGTLRARCPDLKVLFVSGYADQLDAQTAGGPHARLIHKPVTRVVLLEAVAALLKGPAGG